MKKNEIYGLYLVIGAAFIYLFVESSLNYSTYNRQVDSHRITREYDQKLEKQALINQAIEESIKIRHTNNEKSIRIIDSLIALDDKPKISNCDLQNYKLRYLVEANQILIAKRELQKYQKECKHIAETDLVNAAIHISDKNLMEAISSLQMAKNKNAKYSWYLGNLYEMQNDLKNARAEYEHLLSNKNAPLDLIQNRLSNMNEKQLTNFIFLNDLDKYNFFNIKPFFYRGLN